MKLTALIIFSLLCTSLFAAENRINKRCSLAKSMIPKCYHKRDEAVFKVALLYYGDYWKLKDLERIEPILIDRFHKAINGKIRLEVIAKDVFSYKQKMPRGYTYNNITDPARLQRIFYYDNVNAKVMKEVYEEYKKRVTEDHMHQLDAILAVTGAQFNGLGFASGRVSVTEQPREIAWGLEDGGRVEYVSDYQIVDELIHELGHNMFLGHTSTQCQKPELTYQEQRKCCAASPSRNDVLSYCRKRAKVDENFMHGFESCNQGKIERLVIPAMLKGGKWNVDNSLRCR